MRARSRVHGTAALAIGRAPPRLETNEQEMVIAALHVRPYNTICVLQAYFLLSTGIDYAGQVERNVRKLRQDSSHLKSRFKEQGFAYSFIEGALVVFSSPQSFLAGQSHTRDQSVRFVQQKRSCKMTGAAKEPVRNYKR